MTKPLIAAFAALALLTAVSAHAETETYMYTNTSAGGGGSATVNISQYVSEGPSTTTINGETVGPPTGDPAQLPPSVGKQLVPPPGKPMPRETNKELIERLRKAKEDAKNGTYTVTSSGSGTIKIYREVNGEVIEDRTIALPPAPTNAPKTGKPILSRIPMETGTSGIKIFAKANTKIKLATSSNMLFTRATGTKLSPMPLRWLDAATYFPVRFESTTTAEGDVMFTIAERKPIEKFVEGIFKMFRTGADTQIDLIRMNQ